MVTDIVFFLSSLFHITTTAGRGKKDEEGYRFIDHSRYILPIYYINGTMAISIKVDTHLLRVIVSKRTIGSTIIIP